MLHRDRLIDGLIAQLRIDAKRAAHTAENAPKLAAQQTIDDEVYAAVDRQA